MDGFERRREQKKIQILEAALSLFMDFGPQKVSIAEIAKSANVSQVTIYNYFESKDLLIKEVFKYYVDKLWNEQKKLLDSDLPFVEKLKKIAFEKSAIANQINEKFFEEFMKDYSMGQSYLEEIYEKEAIPRLNKLFNEGREKGIIAPHISNEAIGMYMQAFRFYFQRKETSAHVLPHIDELTHLFFFGLTGKKDE
jgi:AcrR family transcriptional regulator